MDAKTRRSHEAHNALDPRRFTREQLRQYLESRATVSVEFAGACLGISRPAAYRAAAAGQIKCLTLGLRRRLVPTVWLQRVLMLEDDARPAGQAPGQACGPHGAHDPNATGQPTNSEPELEGEGDPADDEDARS